MPESHALPKAESSSSTTKPIFARAWKRCSKWKATSSNSPSTAAMVSRKLDKASYDLVLLDLMMPDRSGMDVLATSAQSDHETPVIMLTAYGSVEVAVNAIKAGANDYFSKPWDNEKLLIEIGTHDREGPAGAREHAAQARAQAALQLPQHRRQKRAHAAGARPGGAGGAQPRDDPADRRNGYRQGSHRQGDPRQFAPRRPRRSWP